MGATIDGFWTIGTWDEDRPEEPPGEAPRDGSRTRVWQLRAPHPFGHSMPGSLMAQGTASNEDAAYAAAHAKLCYLVQRRDQPVYVSKFGETDMVKLVEAS